MKKILITGVSGQDGAYLAKLLLAKGHDVTGTIRGRSKLETERLRKLGVADDVRYVSIDLTDMDSINHLIQTTAFDEIYNLAAESFIGSSWVQPVHLADVNGLGVVRWLEAVRNHSPQTRFYQASTSEMFGLVPSAPQNEATPFYPRSPYGTAKVFGHLITRNYREAFGLHASSGILFNHESPLRGAQYVTRKVTLGLSRFARGEQVPVELGNLNVCRDWGFAGDYVEGMWQMLQQPEPDDYVLATGISTSIREFVNHVAATLDLDLEWSGTGMDEQAMDRRSGKIAVKVNPDFIRPTETGLLVGDASKAIAKLGWKAKIGIRELAAMMAKSDYDDWPRGRLDD